MGLLQGIILIIMCIARIIYLCIPTIITLISVQAIVYRLTKISLYNEFKKLMLRGI